MLCYSTKTNNFSPTKQDNLWQTERLDIAFFSIVLSRPSGTGLIDKQAAGCRHATKGGCST